MTIEGLKRSAVGFARRHGFLPAAGSRTRRLLTRAYRQLDALDLRPSNRVVARAYTLFDDARLDEAYDVALAASASQSGRPAYWRLMRDLEAARGEISAQVGWESRLAAAGLDVERFERTQATLRELSGWTPRVVAPHAPIDPVDPLRVVHLVKESRPDFSNGFATRSHHNFLAERDAGLDPVIITEPSSVAVAGRGPVDEVEYVDGITHHRLGLTGVDRRSMPADEFLQLFAELAYARIREIRPAVIHASSGRRGFETGLVGLALKEATGLPLIYEVRSSFEGNWTKDWRREETGELFARRCATEERVMAGADLVLTLCDTLADDLRARGVPADKLGIVPNGVVVEDFAGDGRDAALAARHGLGPEHRTFGYVSNMDHFRESQETLVEAAALLRDDARWRCVLVGGGPRKAEMERLAAKLGVADRVVFTGPVDHADVPRYYRLIDIFVVPRIGERAARLVTPLKPFEAMAAHRPVVVSDVPALREVVDLPHRGEVFAQGDAASLAEVLRRLDADPARREALANAGYAWVREQRQWSDNGRRYREFVERVTKGHR